MENTEQPSGNQRITDQATEPDVSLPDFKKAC